MPGEEEGVPYKEMGTCFNDDHSLDWCAQYGEGCGCGHVGGRGRG